MHKTFKVSQAQALANSQCELKAGEFLYKYSGYFHTWSRILLPNGARLSRGTVEVDVFPQFHGAEFEWSRIEAVWIREHRTASDAYDVWATELPLTVQQRMIERLGEGRAEFLMHGDILDLIDPVKYRRNCNGGCPLVACSTSQSQSQSTPTVDSQTWARLQSWLLPSAAIFAQGVST